MRFRHSPWKWRIAWVSVLAPLGLGTMIATMPPYSVTFLLGWMALISPGVFGLGLPVGPGAPTLYAGP